MRTPVTASAFLAALLLAPLVPATAATAGSGAYSDTAGSARTAARADSARTDAGDSAKPTPAVLAEAEALFDPHSAGTPSRDATLVLLELAGQLDELDGADRARASRVLARPTDPSSSIPATRYRAGAVVETECTTRLCLHWVETTSDAVPATDADADGLPDWAEASLAVAEHVLTSIVDEMGYRAPMDDSAAAEHGPDGLLDVYLTNLGDDGYYGYCVSEPAPGATRRSSPGYCVLDNDFAVADFPGVPMANLQVTMAHELFHAVQFGYDAGEDFWLMEGGAAWMEEQLYDAVNDNRQYLADSPLAYPLMPLDYASAGFYTYGSWAFFQLLTERFGGNPTFMRRVWERADDSVGAPRQYGLQALTRVLADRGFPISEAVARFGAANLTPARSYAEGRHFPAARPVKAFSLTRADPDPGGWAIDLNHLSNSTFRYRPHTTLPRTARLAVTLDLPPTARGSVANLIVVSRGGALTRVAVRLDASGDGHRTVGFSPRQVSRVDVVLTNASTRYRCGEGTLLSCEGTALDDGLRSKVFARALRR